MEINNLREEAKQLCVITEKSKISRIKKRIQFIQLAENYLINEPNTDYLKLSISQTKDRIDRLIDLTPYDLDRSDKNPEMSKKVKDYDRKEGITKMKLQLKFMNYLIS